MIIRVNDINDSLRRLSATEQVSDYPTLVAVQHDGLCEFLSPLALEFTALREYDHIRVEGKVTVEVALNCARCLTPYQIELVSRFTIFYSKALGNMPRDEEVELAEEELVSATYDGDEIDLTPEVAEHVIMELPIKPLCQEGCRGLCTSCGIDLNAGNCNCEMQKGSFAFSALKNLKLDR